MKVLLIYPPFAYPLSIYASAPILLGQLKNNGIDAYATDMNVEFFKYILSRENIIKTKQRLEEIYKTGVQSEEHKAFLENLLFKQKDKLQHIIDISDKLYDIMINNEEMQKEDESLQYAFDFVFALNYPSYIKSSFSGFASIVERNKEYRNNYNELIKRCTDRNQNLYIEYFENKIKEINADKYDVIGITIPFETHLYPGLTLAKILKDNTNAKIAIGGVIINSTIDSYINNPGMFDLFADAILTGEGEKALLEYVYYAAGKIKKEQVSGIVYKDEKDGRIIKNPPARISRIEEIKPPCYDDFNFNDYADKVIQLEFSKGCYWGKCTYCYANLQKRYHITNPVKAADIIEELVKKHGIKKYSILDDSLNINFAEKLADELIKRELNINFIAFFRFEKNLKYNVLEKLSKAGLNGIFFGLESGSERILKLMNKGIDINTAERILKDANTLGIIVHIGVIFGFPTENRDDVKKTINFLQRNKEYINKINPFYFTLLKSSGIFTIKDKIGMRNISEPEIFSDYLLYEAPSLAKDELKSMLKEAHMQGLPIYTKW